MKSTHSITFLPSPSRGSCWICKAKGKHKWFDSDVKGLVCEDCISSAAFVDAALSKMMPGLRLTRTTKNTKR